MADYHAYFDRVSIRLEDGKAESRDAAALPTDGRLEAFAHGRPDPALAALSFNFGRHLLISSSRPGLRPQDRPIPIGELTAEEKAIIRRRYPHLLDGNSNE